MLMKGDYDEILLKWELVGKTSEIVMTSLFLSLMCWKVSCPFSPSYWERDVCVCVWWWWYSWVVTPKRREVGGRKVTIQTRWTTQHHLPHGDHSSFSIDSLMNPLSLSFSFFDTSHKTPFNDHPFEFISPNVKFGFAFLTGCFFFPFLFSTDFFGVLHIHVIIIGCGRKLTSQMRPLKISHKSSLSLYISKVTFDPDKLLYCLVSEGCLMGDGTVQNLDLLSLFMQNLKP